MNFVFAKLVLAYLIMGLIVRKHASGSVTKFSALDKLLGQLGIYPTKLSSIVTLRNQLGIFFMFYATFLAVITYVFLLNEAIVNVPTYLLSSSAFLSIKLVDFYCS